MQQVELRDVSYTLKEFMDDALCWYWGRRNCLFCSLRTTWCLWACHTRWWMIGLTLWERKLKENFLFVSFGQWRAPPWHVFDLLSIWLNNNLQTKYMAACVNNRTAWRLECIPRLYTHIPMVSNVEFLHSTLGSYIYIYGLYFRWSFNWGLSIQKVTCHLFKFSVAWNKK